jgi:hypothetical protein
MRVKVQDVLVEEPLYQWLLGRLSDEQLKTHHCKLYQQLWHSFTCPSRSCVIEYLKLRFSSFTDIPILVEETRDREYVVREGHVRLVLLYHQGKNSVDTELFHPQFNGIEWELHKQMRALGNRPCFSYRRTLSSILYASRNATHFSVSQCTSHACE